jgi:hypothetical protein
VLHTVSWYGPFNLLGFSITLGFILGNLWTQVQPHSIFLDWPIGENTPKKM